MQSLSKRPEHRGEMDNLRLSPVLPLEFKRASVDATGTFEGYAATFGGTPDSYGDILQKGCFAKALRSHKQRGTQPAMLWSHDRTIVLGKWLDIHEDNNGLFVVGQLTMEVQKSKEVAALLRDGVLAFSFGYTVARGGATKINGIRQIKEMATLAEISLVSIPANTNAKVTASKAPDFNTIRGAESYLRDAGISGLNSKRYVSEFKAALLRDVEGNHGAKLDEILAGIDSLQQLQRGL